MLLTADIQFFKKVLGKSYSMSNICLTKQNKKKHCTAGSQLAGYAKTGDHVGRLDILQNS